MEYSLRKALVSDIEFLLNLRHVTMDQYLKESGMPTSKEAYLSRVLYEFEHAQIIVVNGSDAGFFKVKVNEDSSEWDLVQIQIHPNYQNQKIASSLISTLIEKADAANQTVGLSVLKTNPAKHLYSRLGFVQVDENEFECFMRYKSNQAFMSNS